MDQSLASVTKLKNQDKGKPPLKSSPSLPGTEAASSGANGLVHSEGCVNSHDVNCVNVKPISKLLQNISGSTTTSRINSLNESTSRATPSEKLESINSNISVTSSSSMPKVQGRITLGQSNMVVRGQTASVTRGMGSSAISVPPGFQNLSPAQHSVQDHVSSQSGKAGTHGQSDLSHINKPHLPNNLGNSNHAVAVSQSGNHQEKKQVQQNILKQQEQEQLRSQQVMEPDRQWGFWQNAAVTQVHLNSKAQKQDGDSNNKYQITSTTSSQSSQSHQQQYPYSISPAALFHMASQAAGGQISAMLLPSATENNTPSRPGLPASTGAVGNPASGAPPGFSAPVPINYHGQQIDALPMNKLLIGSSVFRSSVSQADGQSATPNTASQPFLSVSGAMPGIYVSTHTPHNYSDPSLNQRHPVFDTRHFISQQVSQGLHQNVAQGLPQGVSATVPPGMQAGTSVSLTTPPGLPAPLSQGINNSVPQGMHQNIQSGMSQVNLGSAVSQGMQAMPIGHPFPPQHTYPQQSYQVSLSLCCMHSLY